MKRFTVAATVFPLVAMVAVAQESTAALKKALSPLPSTVMGNAVKGAPYSADEITESLQVLGDGTRISNQTKVTVYRDGDGRVRRENGREITISDPVDHVSYTLNPKTMTAVKSSMGWTTTVSPGGTEKLYFFTSGTQTVTTSAEPANAQETAARLDKLKAELAASQAMVVNGVTASTQMTAAMKADLDAAMAKVKSSARGKVETLGQQIMEGVPAEGTRTTTTIEAGEIGNDRPISVVSERWYSSELQTPVMSKHSDPRTGEETFRLANVRRGEPGADLFMVPAGYTIRDGLAPKAVTAPSKKEE